MIKVVMPCLYPLHGVVGGVAEHVYRLTKALGESDKIDLYVISFGDTDSFSCDGNVIIKIVKRRWFYYLFPPLSVIRLAREVSNIEPDIIHSHGTNMSPYLIYMLFLAPRKYRKIITVHGLVSIETALTKGIKSNITEFVGKPLEKYAVSKIPDIIAPSPAVKSIIGRITKSRIHVVPNGVDFDSVRNIQPCKSINYPCIFFAGVLEKIKGVDVLIKAIPIIKSKILNIHVYIAGSGSLENELKSLVKKLNIKENVQFLGYVSGDEKYSYYKSADIFVLPSLWDSAPVVLPEAMACGKPVVASDVGGIPYVVKDGKTGLLFEPGNVEELAEKVITLMKNEELRENMGSAGKERAKEFTWEKIAERTIRVYEKIIKF